jgi:tagatose-6-phosphate ketose/aldose isomerase
MKYLGLDSQTLARTGAVHTAKEICQQPEVWEKIFKEVYQRQGSITSFLSKALVEASRIILTGAGTSAYIGTSLTGVFERTSGITSQAISTADLVTHPRDYFTVGGPLLMVSFARSGNSPESVAAAVLADELCQECYHLVVTCNSEGDLARYTPKDPERKFVFILPEEANDQGLAMTSSYTGMLLSGLLIAEIHNIQNNKRVVSTLATYGRKIIDYCADELADIAKNEFTRAVFLGSGPLFGTARESHLKLQELTDGRIICKEDSFLGFRHGPKAVIDGSTLVCYIFSNSGYVSKYEKDLVYSMKKGNRPLVEIGIMETVLPDLSLDHSFHLSENGSALEEEYLAVCSVLPAQILGFFKSLQLGLCPDTPSETGAITRVVEGVQIYDLNG